jgi:simple sugar transport system permease protein
MEALLEATLRLAAPLLLAALGELVIERAGLIDVGIEGTMLTGAFAGFVVAVATGSALAGVAAAAGAGLGVGALFAAFAVYRRTDQIVVGTAVNLLALGATGAASRALYAGAPPSAPTLGALASGPLAELPWLGALLFAQTPFVCAGWLLALAVGLVLARTRPGLRLRAVGESARAADAEGVAVPRVRAAAVLIGSALAGLAGAALSLAQSDSFTEGMTAGRGFIALAIVIFGRWSALGVLLASLFFGCATALQFRLQARGVAIPYPVFLMFPYLITLAVLALAAGSARAPADLGRPYAREAS